MSKILAPLLGTALALAPQVARAGEAVHKPLDLLAEQTLQEVTLVVNNENIAFQCSPAWEETAKRHGYNVYRDATSRCYAWERSYEFLDTSKAIGTIMKPKGENVDPHSCITARTYVDEFTREGTRYLVIDPSDVESTNMLCPVPDEAPTATTVSSLKPVYSEGDIPSSGNLGLLDPKLIEEGKFLKPIKLGLEEAQLDTKLDNPTNHIHRSSKGVDVYAKYEVLEYDPSKGRIVLRPGNGKKGATCDIAIQYEDSFVQDGQRYFVIADDYTTTHRTCDEASLHAAKPSTSASTGAASHPALRAALLAGLELDEVVDPGFGPSAEVAAVLTVRPLPSRFSVGVMTDIIVSPTGSGFEGVNGMVGSQGDTLGVYGIAGLGFEPRWDREDDPTTPEVEKDPFDGVFAAGALVTVDLPLKGPVGATCGVSGELHWGGGSFPLNVGVLCGGTFDFDLDVAGKGKDEKPVPVQVPGLPDAVVPPAMPRLETNKKPYSVEIKKKLNAPKQGSEEQAGITQKFEDMRKAALRNMWESVEEKYDSLIQIYSNKKKLTLTSDIHLLGAEAARALGNAEETYERLQYALQCAEQEGNTSNIKKTSDWLSDFTNVYGRVEITSPDGTVLAAAPSPFAPDARMALEVAIAGVADDGDFVGFIPLFDGYTDGVSGTPIEYTLNGVKLEGVLPLADSMETTEIVLEQ